ncbi:MAG: hypothetical protein L0Y58_15505 [Verrucomicrobia subdivision 3 bacterium]|nr:hypothetical protein [Limisphaerales bacterium]
MKKWVETWKTTGPILERLRREEVKQTDTTESILILNDAFESARLHYPLRPTSGLVEQQAWFMKALEA